MRAGNLKAILDRCDPGLEIVIRAQWEGDEPNGCCFRLDAVVRDQDHATGEPFLAFECDQEDEEAALFEERCSQAFK
jgi:hypothetical protein